MSELLAGLNAKAIRLGIPLGVHLDVTWRCNERCVHCYLDHDDKGEMTTAEIIGLIDQMAEAAVFFLTISGGEPMLRKDLFPILEHARRHRFSVKLKTNGILIREKEAARIADLGIESVQVSVYSHRPEIHDAITKAKGSLNRSLTAIRFLVGKGLKVTIAHVVMRLNRGDYGGVRTLARELGAEFTIDPTITPHISGDRALLVHNVPRADLEGIMRDPNLVGRSADMSAPAPQPVDDDLDGLPCSAGHSACYVSPYGDVFPCVQFPLPSGNVREQRFIDIWRHSPQLKKVRTIREQDLPVCGACIHSASCTRCPGLAFMEGNMRGPSTADCEKSYARTGVPSAHMQQRGYV